MYFKDFPFMRIVLFYVCIPLMMTALFSCSKKGATTVQSESFFIVGSGGGVSGNYTQYKVHEKGRVELYDFSAKKYIPYSTLSTSMNDKLWSQLRELNISKLNLDQPGNYNYYIELDDAGGRNKIKWNDEVKLPKEISSFFRAADTALGEMK